MAVLFHTMRINSGENPGAQQSRCIVNARCFSVLNNNMGLLLYLSNVVGRTLLILRGVGF